VDQAQFRSLSRQSSVDGVIRRLLLVVLFASLGTAAFTSLEVASGSLRPTRGMPEVTDLHPTASVAEAPSAAVDAVLVERVERVGEVARSESRQPSRHHRTPLWGVAALVAALTVTALLLTIARRRTGHAAIRIRTIAPARAPPLSFAGS
jgi:hypothetical protein